MRRLVQGTLLSVVSALAGIGVMSLVGGGPGGLSLSAQPRLTRVSADDFVAIQQLLWDNHWGYDFAIRDGADLWTSTFLPDARIDSDAGVHLSGHAEIRQYALDPIKQNPDRRLRHWTSTFQITPNKEGAILKAFWYTVADDGKPGSKLTIGVTGWYESQVVRTSQGWKIKRHGIHPEGGIVAPPRG